MANLLRTVQEAGPYMKTYLPLQISISRQRDKAERGIRPPFPWNCDNILLGMAAVEPVGRFRNAMVDDGQGRIGGILQGHGKRLFLQ